MPPKLLKCSKTTKVEEVNDDYQNMSNPLLRKNPQTLFAELGATTCKTPLERQRQRKSGSA